MPILNKDMVLCISLAARPSNIGTRFHNFLYDELGLNFIYKAFTTNDIEAAIGGVRALGIRGCSVSMPFKEAVIPLVDEIEPSAAAIETELLERHAVDPALPVLVRGSGGMGKAVVAAFRGAGFDDVTVVARNAEAGARIAEKYGFRSTTTDPAPGHAVLVNVTPLGMAGADADILSFSQEHVDAAQTVFDVVAYPAETPLIRAARAGGIPVITGAEVIALQAARQFERYTGVTPTLDQIQRASEFSRQ